MSVKNYKELRIWQKGVAIVEEVYKTTALFPKNDLYGLVIQMRKAAVSIPSNIAEGFSRRHTKEYKQFLHIAYGSCAELETQLIIAEKIGYSMKSDLLKEYLDHEARMLKTVIQKLDLIKPHTT